MNKEKPSLFSSSPSCSLSSPESIYDVYLCFSGSGSASGFVSHLYRALLRERVIPFTIDLSVGGPITEAIEEEIQRSRISVVVFSENFASSPRSLEELVAISECWEQRWQTVVPIYYDVQQSNVKGPGGIYKVAMDDHRMRRGFESQRVDRWEAAMRTIGSLSGWDSSGYRSEAVLVDDVVNDLLAKLKQSSSIFSSVVEGYVGMDTRMEKMEKYLDVSNLRDVRFIGVFGLKGIGKTTIARLVYEKICSQFEGSGFLSDVRESRQRYGLVHLQEQLLSRLVDGNIKLGDPYEGMVQIKRKLSSRRVLVVLDDVDQVIQLESLTGVGDGDGWFGPGSRIIITTRDESIFRGFQNANTVIYRVEGLRDDEALQLFCMKAFQKRQPEKGFEKLCNKFVEYANHNPLALSTFGLYLFGHNVEEWKSVWKWLRKDCDKQLMDKLRLDFDGLEDHEKMIFLDIACFFNGENTNTLIEIFRSCGVPAVGGIAVLKERCLITISDYRVYMDRSLQKLGRHIVLEEHKEPGNRSRLWLYKDVYHALKNIKETNKVEGIALDSAGREDRQLKGKAFSELKKLRVLKLKNLNLSGGLKHLSDGLRYLQWHRYPFKLLPSSFIPTELVELHMPYSKIEELWKGVKLPRERLKVIDLSYCQNLKETLDFRIVPNLEKLKLTGCRRLFEVHRSIKVLNKLVVLDLENCKSLEVFPNEIRGLTSLQNLNLCGCRKLRKLPKLGDMESLLELLASGIARARVPSLCGLCYLRKLHLINCSLKEDAIPKDLSCFPWLECLNLSGNDFVSIPRIQNCSNLEKLSLDDCKSLVSVPDLPLHIKNLYLRNCSSLTSLQGLNELSELEELILSGCKRLQLLKDLPLSIKKVAVDDCTSLEAFPDPVGMCTYRPLWLSFANCKKLDEFQVVLAWLKFYVQTLVENKHERNRELSIFLPKSTILGLCKFRGARSNFDVRLDPNWCNDKFMGFCICAVLDFQQPRVYRVKGDLFAYREQAEQGQDRKRLGKFDTAMSLDDCASDQLWFLFIPHDKSRSVDWWNAFTLFKFESSIAYLELEVRSWGFSTMYEQDVKMLMECVSSDQLNLPCSSESKKRKRSDDDNSCGDEVDLSRNGNFLKFVLNDFSDDSEDDEDEEASTTTEEDEKASTEEDEEASTTEEDEEASTEKDDSD